MELICKWTFLKPLSLKTDKCGDGKNKNTSDNELGGIKNATHNTFPKLT
jgi:hypothetical protein